MKPAASPKGTVPVPLGLPRDAVTDADIPKHRAVAVPRGGAPFPWGEPGTPQSARETGEGTVKGHGSRGGT